MLVHIAGKVILCLDLCCISSSFFSLKTKRLNALWSRLPPCLLSRRWHLFLLACPTATSFSSTRMHCSCNKASWVGLMRPEDDIDTDGRGKLVGLGIAFTKDDIITWKTEYTCINNACAGCTRVNLCNLFMFPFHNLEKIASWQISQLIWLILGYMDVGLGRVSEHLPLICLN